MKNSTTKKALLMSVLSLLLCFSMLIGTTYAWFTDEVTSGTNTIVAGNLDVELTHKSKNVAEETVAGATNLFRDVDANKWEPNAMAMETFTVKNLGNLALKYKLSLNVSDVSTGKDGTSFATALKVAVVSGTVADRAVAEAIPASRWKTLSTVFEAGDLMPTENGVADEDVWTVIIWWKPSANDNNFNMNNGATGVMSATIGVKLFATQLQSESDSFDNTYDNGAIISGSGFASVPDGNTSALEIPIFDDGNIKNASFTIPAEAVAAGVDTLQANISESEYEGNFTIAAGHDKQVYDIEVIGLKDDNNVPVKVLLKIPAGLDPATVSAYHYDTPILGASYDPTTGYVGIETTDFSPFTLVYDAESEFVAPVVPDGKYPTATVTDFDLALTPGYSTAVQWGSFGGFRPDTTVDPDPKLEAAFKFACPDYEKATDELKEIIDAYRYWYCDFFVSLDTDLEANQILLGGNYGDFGWVGFHNGDLALSANTEIPLLSSVTSNPWTYESIESFVGEFICGVGDVNDALAGAKFTVKLRLINPEKVDTSVNEWWTLMDEDAYVDVNVVTHTFDGDSVIKE